MIHKSSALVILGATLLATSAAQALSPPPPLPEETLVALYEELNGDNWTHNDGWLDPDVPICDWYGISCVTEAPESGGFEWIGYIRLADNNLQGQLSESLLERLNGMSAAGVPSIELDLSGNAIGGELPELPVGVPRLILSDNQLEGPLPPPSGSTQSSGTSPAPTNRLERLDLSGNQFEGPVPETWESLSLRRLDLSDNRLEGDAEPALDALDPATATFIDLSDNAFSGELPAWVTELPLQPELGAVGTINICWTELSANEPATREWLAERHVGGADFESCLTRERRALDASVSGSWFEPERSGEGYSVMLLDSGVPLVYWFTHLSMSRQMWLIGTGRHDDTTLRVDELLQTEGRFGEGFGSVEMPITRKGELRLDGIADGPLHLSSEVGYSTSDLAQPDIGPIIFLPNPLDFRADLARLSELAGTTCDNQSEFQQFSGAWYDPERSGEGLIVEVLPDDRANVYWFTYEPGESGRQAWMIGQGQIGPGDTCMAVGCEAPTVIEITEMRRPIDTGQTFPADLDGVENTLWGEVWIALHDDDTGRVFYETQDADFGEGEFPIERLATPMLAECN
jgi:hypothetical protein